ncbi:MAG: glycosyltransferase family 39 protein, partial [Anaerolineae bacterium]
MDTHPPLYPAVLWGTIRLIGKSPFAVRFPSALAGLVTVALIYRFGRAIGKGTALWALGLASTSALLIYRTYALTNIAQAARPVQCRLTACATPKTASFLVN